MLFHVSSISNPLSAYATVFSTFFRKIRVRKITNTLSGTTGYPCLYQSPPFEKREVSNTCTLYRIVLACACTFNTIGRNCAHGACPISRCFLAVGCVVVAPNRNNTFGCVVSKSWTAPIPNMLQQFLPGTEVDATAAAYRHTINRDSITVDRVHINRLSGVEIRVLHGQVFANSTLINEIQPTLRTRNSGLWLKRNKTRLRVPDCRKQPRDMLSLCHEIRIAHNIMLRQIPISTQEALDQSVVHV